MSAPVAPPSKYLTLPEAVASVCPPLEEGDARRAIEEALCDGSLVETPRPLWTAQEDDQFLWAASAPDDGGRDDTALAAGAIARWKQPNSGDSRGLAGPILRACL